MEPTKKIITVLTYILLAMMAYASYQGVFNPVTFARDSQSFGTQGIGQDFVNLFIVAPVLLVSLYLYLHENKIGFFLFGGTVLYILYSYIIYAFGVHFNHLFLFYSLIVGSSLFLFIMFMADFSKKAVIEWFEAKIPVKTMSTYMIVTAIMFYCIWLGEIIPALISGTTPKTITDNNLLVNPVHVLDLAFSLPALIVSAVLLLKKHNLGYIFAPVLLVFIVILTIALSGMAVALTLQNISENFYLVYIFSVLSLLCVIILVLFFRKIK
ncbi:MAG: hypothetical protein JXQ65_14190 [Candidatus Marinimicrobia bacterium]|nr:hypothetical protein [Candidatus Neomarinimicrobiota bacterium]